MLQNRLRLGLGAGNRLRGLVYQGRTLVNQAGVDLHHIGASLDFADSIGSTQNPAHADDGKAFA